MRLRFVFGRTQAKYGEIWMLSFALLSSGLGRNHGEGAAAEKIGPRCGRQGLSPLDNDPIVSLRKTGGPRTARGSEKGTPGQS